MLRLIRFLTFSIHIIFYLLFGGLVNLLIIPFTKPLRRKIISMVTQSWAIGMCWIFNIEIKVEGKNNIKSKDSYLIVANHLSYFDTCLIGAVIPTQFVGKREVIKWPIFGWLSLIGGVIFIDRSKLTQGASRAKIVADSLSEGNSVVVFPESTTSNGDKLLPFKPSFYLAVIESKKPVLPLTITFGSINGKQFKNEEKELYAWFQSETFFGHGFRMLTVRKIVMNLIIHKPIYPEEGMDARTIMKLSQESVQSGLPSLN